MTEKNYKKITLQIEGMSCASCAQAVEKGLNKTEGVKNANLNFAAEKAYVEYDPERIDEEKLTEVVRSTGYDVKDEREKLILKIGGMSCASCAATVEKSLNNFEGVYRANVNIASEKGTIEYDPEELNLEDFREIIGRAGYEVIRVEGDEPTSADRDKDLEKVEKAKKKMWGTWAFTIPIIVWMLPEMFFNLI